MGEWRRWVGIGLLCMLPAAAAAAPPRATIFPVMPHAWGEILGLAPAHPVHPGLSGDWGGQRAHLEEKGITFSGLYTGETDRNYDPGLINPHLETIYHDNLDLTLTVDTAKAGLWPGGTLFIYALRNHGGQPSAHVIGDLQGASNIESPDQFIIEEAWYQQQLKGGKLSLLAGLRDINNEFYISKYGALFINSSFGIGPEMTVNVPTSTFPRAGLAARIRIKPMRHVYVQLASFDGNPATRSLSGREGQMAIVEAGIVNNTGGYKLGAWVHTATHVYAGHSYGDDYGAYAIVDQQLAAIGAMRIGAFMQYGWVPPVRNQVTHYLGLGLHVLGLLPRRDQDILGLGLADAATHTGMEQTIELTYRMTVSSDLVVQPSFQWIANPGGVSGRPPIRVGILHFEISL
jgi:porin